MIKVILKPVLILVIGMDFMFTMIHLKFHPWRKKFDYYMAGIK